MSKINFLLHQIKNEYVEILQTKLVGIYLHGSLAFDCFNWNTSDIDFIVVVKDRLTQKEKVAMISCLIAHSPGAPQKGFEMSVILSQYCSHFVYPTPYELHFSNMHLASAKADINAYCQRMNGTDSDLAAHFTVIKERGKVLEGAPIDEVFGEVPKADYLSSIRADVADALETVNDNPVYVILNLCRVLAFVKNGGVLSKPEGAAWGLENLPDDYHPLVQAALDQYNGESQQRIDSQLSNSFVIYMNEAIFGMTHLEFELGTFLDKRWSAADDSEVAAIDQEIWQKYGGEWCVMYTDLSGFSRSAYQRGILHTLSIIHAFRSLAVPIITVHGGLVMKTEGDSLIVLFDHVIDALHSALEIKTSLTRFSELHGDLEIFNACGIGYGSILKLGAHELYGLEVNLASKLGEDIGTGDDILLTEAAKNQIEGLPEWRYEPFVTNEIIGLKAFKLITPN